MGELLGRQSECDAITQLLAATRAGRSGVLVVRGEAGMGKTVLLEHARDVAATSGFEVQSAVAVEAETQFAFAGLHQLCAPVLDRAAALPDPQRDALHVAFGMRDGPAPGPPDVSLQVHDVPGGRAPPDPRPDAPTDEEHPMSVQLLNPEGLIQPVPYHHVAIGTGSRQVHVAGQTAHDSDGRPLAPGDLAGQVGHALRSAHTGLQAAGAGFGDVVRLTFYVTDWTPDKIEPFLAGVEAVADELGLPRPMPPASLIGVASLFEPGVLVEVEATAVLA